jgi:two-component system cell cycle sensor histidine kinase/response regulator CckA
MTTPTAREVFRNLPATGNGHAVPFRYKTQDGRWRQYESVVSWAVDEKGEKIQAVVVARDIEDRRQLEDQVRQAQKMDAVGRLAGRRGPRFQQFADRHQRLFGFAAAGFGGRRPAPRRRGGNQGHRRPGGGPDPTIARFFPTADHPTDGDGREHGGGPAGKNAAPADRGGHRLKTVLAPDLHRTRADVGQIEQVIMNLSVNAREAMPQGGTLILETANVTVGARGEAPAGEYALGSR